MSKLTSYAAAIIAFILLILYPETASEGVKNGLSLCGNIILPSLFPFFVATGLLSELGFTRLLGNILSPLSAKLFNVSGSGGSAFVIGLTGGYPLGASHISSLCKNGEISVDEAAKLLVFCNNSGPAFIIGAVGTGVFKSASAGLFLYSVHIISAAIGGVIFSDKNIISTDKSSKVIIKQDFSQAVTLSVKNAVSASLSVCGFVIAFSVLSSILEALSLFSQTAGFISAFFGTELHWSRALISGFFELGNGVGAMTGLSISPINLALAAFLLGWGGISVHFQSFSMISGIKVKTDRYILGRFFIALTGFALALLGGALFF